MTETVIDKAGGEIGMGESTMTRLFVTRAQQRVAQGDVPDFLSAAEGCKVLQFIRRRCCALGDGKGQSKTMDEFNNADARGLYRSGTAGDFNRWLTAYLVRHNDPMLALQLAFEARNLKQGVNQPLLQYLAALDTKLQSVPDAIKSAQVAPHLLQNLQPSWVRTAAQTWASHRQRSGTLTYVGLTTELKLLVPSELAVDTTEKVAAASDDAADGSGGRRNRWQKKAGGTAAAVNTVGAASAPGFKGNAGAPFSGTCHTCGKEGHRQNECPDVVCRVCRKKGHVSSACPGMGCFVCGKTGHMAPACPDRKCLCGALPAGHAFATCPA